MKNKEKNSRFDSVDTRCSEEEERMVNSGKIEGINSAESEAKREEYDVEGLSTEERGKRAYKKYIEDRKIKEAEKENPIQQVFSPHRMQKPWKYQI
jgi:hypothetical protein